MDAGLDTDTADVNIAPVWLTCHTGGQACSFGFPYKLPRRAGAGLLRTCAKGQCADGLDVGCYVFVLDSGNEVTCCD